MTSEAERFEYPIELRMRAWYSLHGFHGIAPWSACLEAMVLTEDDLPFWEPYLQQNVAVLAQELLDTVRPVLRAIVAGVVTVKRQHTKMLSVDAAVADVMQRLGGDGQSRAEKWRTEAADRFQASKGDLTAATSAFMATANSSRTLPMVCVPGESGEALPVVFQGLPASAEDFEPFVSRLIGDTDASVVGIPDPASSKAFRRIAATLWRVRWRAAALEAQPHLLRAIAPAIPSGHYQRSLAPLETAESITERDESFAVVDRNEQLTFFPPMPAIPLEAIQGIRKIVERQEWLPTLVERLIIHLAREVWQAFGNREIDSRLRVYEGGWRTLCEQAGIPQKHEHHLPGVVAALRAWKGSDGRQPALIADFWVRHSSPGKKAEVRLLVGEGLVPGYALTLPKGDGRRLLPVLAMPTLEIPGIGKDRAGDILRYRWELLTQLREIAASEVGGIAEDGGIIFPAKTRKLVARRAGLTELEAEAVNRVWIGAGSGAWLDALDEERVRIADPFATALIENAARQAEGRRAAHRSKKPSGKNTSKTKSPDRSER